MKPKLLIVELWGLGDLVIATSFLRAVTEKFQVTLLAKPFALDLQPRLWPEVRVETFIAPWTAFKNKYILWRWPYLEMLRLRRRLKKEQFDFGLSARFDPRDHLLLKLFGAKTRLGFPRLHTEIFLNHPVVRPDPQAHRYESWRSLAKELKIELPQQEKNIANESKNSGNILIHTGAGQSVRVWPLKKYKDIALRLRQKNYRVQIVCDPDQRDWWLHAGEANVLTPRTVTELITAIDVAAAFIGNDSGPGHLAAACGAPTFTIFGPQLPEWFAPLHPRAEWIEGKACPYKPCSDYCRFPTPFCIQYLSADEVISRVENFLQK